MHYMVCWFLALVEKDIHAMGGVFFTDMIGMSPIDCKCETSVLRL